MSALPEFAVGPLAALDNLALPPPRMPKRRGKKKSRFRQIEKRFGVKPPKKKASRRSMDQLMLDLTPKWQRPALEDRQREQHARQQCVGANKRVRRPRMAGLGDGKKGHTLNALKASANVPMKFSNLKPSWRQVAALEADDGSTQSAITSLLHSGIRLSMHSEEVDKENDSNLRTNANDTHSGRSSQNDSGITNRRSRLGQVLPPSSSAGAGRVSGGAKASSWKPRFLAQLPAKRSQKATHLLLELQNTHSRGDSASFTSIMQGSVSLRERNGDKRCDEIRHHGQSTNGAMKLRMPRIKKNVNSKNNARTRRRNKHPTKSSTKSTRRYGFAERKLENKQMKKRDKEERKTKMMARSRGRKTVSYRRSKTTVTNSEKKMKKKICQGDMTFLTGVHADSDYDDDGDGEGDAKDEDCAKLSKMRRAGGNVPLLKTYKARGRKKTTNGRRKVMRSKSHTHLCQRQSCTQSSRRTMSSSSSLTSLSQYSSRPAETSSTFLTSLDDIHSPNRKTKPAQSKLRQGIRSRLMEPKQNPKLFKRSVKSAPIPIRDCLRLSPDSRRLRMAWMQKPVLNTNSGKYNISDVKGSAVDRRRRGRRANFRTVGQRKRRSRNAISAKLRKSTQRLAKLSSSVRRQRELSSITTSSSTGSTNSASINMFCSPMGNAAKQLDQTMPIGMFMCSPPSPTLEQMAVKQSSDINDDGALAFTSTFLTSSFALLDPSDPVLPVSDTVASSMLPTITARRSKRTRKKHNIVRQLGPAF